MRFPYLIWDFDGTLFDTYPPLIRSIVRALGDFDVIVPSQRVKTMLRGTMSHTLSVLAAEHALNPDHLADRVSYYQRQLTPRDQRPFPGAITLLEQVLAMGGQNFLVTHRDADSLVTLLSWYRVDGFFADVITADDGFPRKPDPASFLAVIERYHLPRMDVLAIGDRDLDIQAGKAARVHTCLFNAQPSPGVLPDYVIAAYSELESIIRLTPYPISLPRQDVVNRR